MCALKWGAEGRGRVLMRKGCLCRFVSVVGQGLVSVTLLGESRMTLVRVFFLLLIL